MDLELTGNVAGMLKLLGGSEVEITQLLTEGTAIALVKVDDNTITLYAPNGFSGDYNDLTNKPIIPTITSGLDNPSGGNDGDVYFKLHRQDAPIEHTFSPVWTPTNSWHVVNNPYYENFAGYKGTFSFQGTSNIISKDVDEIPIFDSTVQNNPYSYTFWARSAYKWCSIARSADNTKLYFYDNAGNASYYEQYVLTLSNDIDGIDKIYYKYNGTWLEQIS